MKATRTVQWMAVTGLAVMFALMSGSASLSAQVNSAVAPRAPRIGIATNTSTGTWTYQSNASGLFEGASRGCHSAVYDPSSNRMIVFAGAEPDENAAGLLNDVEVLENADGLPSGAGPWVTLIANGAAGSPPARECHSAVYDSLNNRMIVFAGCPFGSCFNDVWVLENANGVSGTPTWQQLSPTGGPPSGRLAHTAVYDQANNRMIVFAGLSVDNFDSVPDVWVLSNANGLGGTPVWTQLSPAGTPPVGQISHAAVYDGANNILIVFAGLNNGETRPTNAVSTLSNANGLGSSTPTWTNLIADGAPGSPARRASSTAVYNSATNRMTIFGGSPGTLGNSFFGAFNDTWVLANANGIGGTSAWTKLSPGTGPPGHALPGARDSHTSVYDQQHNIMIIYGGATAEAVFRSVWTLSHADGL